MLFRSRMITMQWDQFDMMNATFIPKKMTPWELQQEFYHANKKFYNFKSPFMIGKIFGIEYGIRRMGLAVFGSIGVFSANLASIFAKKSQYYYIKHYINDKKKRLNTLNEIFK